VGEGVNVKYYPSGCEVVGLDPYLKREALSIAQVGRGQGMREGGWEDGLKGCKRAASLPKKLPPGCLFVCVDAFLFIIFSDFLSLPPSLDPSLLGQI